jgi:hypothetical protein
MIAWWRVSTTADRGDLPVDLPHVSNGRYAAKWPATMPQAASS